MQKKPFLAFLVVAALAAITTPAFADRYTSPSRFGLGLELGAPSGLSGKYFLGGMAAVQGGVGVIEAWGYDGLHVHAEAVWHPLLIKRAPAVDIPLYAGIGGRFLQHDHGWARNACWNGRVWVDCNGDSDTHLGLRAPVGIAFLLRNTPMDFFVELALVVDLVHLDNDYMYEHDHAGLHGALGGRYYF
jgi:hypothetical protein